MARANRENLAAKFTKARNLYTKTMCISGCCGDFESAMDVMAGVLGVKVRWEIKRNEWVAIVEGEV